MTRVRTLNGLKEIVNLFSYVRLSFVPIQSRCGVNGKLIVYPRAKQWYENIDHIVIAHTKVTCCREGTLSV